MKINSSYLLATKAQKIPENPDSGMVKKNGLYYPSWATDYLLVPAQIVSDANENVCIPAASSTNNIYGTTIAAGQESGGYCLIYDKGDWTDVITTAGWSVDKAGAGKQWDSTDAKAQIFTFPSLISAKKALLTGSLSDCVWHSGRLDPDYTGHSLYFYAIQRVSGSGYPYYTGLTGLYQLAEYRQGVNGEIFEYTISTQSLGKYYASRSLRVRITATVLSNDRYVWITLAARALT